MVNVRRKDPDRAKFSVAAREVNDPFGFTLLSAMGEAAAVAAKDAKTRSGKEAAAP